MFRKLTCLLVAVAFLCSLAAPVPRANADELSGLPRPGEMVSLSPAYEPALIKGLSVHKDNPFLFDFMVDTGNSAIAGNELKKQGDRLVKYFFACLTIPEKDLWVNLSPYEKDKMVPRALGQTALGRDLLAQDYILKQLTASLIYPERDLGKAFWDRVYAKARQKYGTTRIPVDTFNKVWILADKASVYEHGQTAFVLSGHLKVMMEEDYLALQKHHSTAVPAPSANGRSPEGQAGIHAAGSEIVRQIVLPEIEKEVNQGQNFATLRQIFNSLILATWYKKTLKEALLNQVYANKSMVQGVNLSDPSVKEQIYQQYLKAYKKGVFNYIKEEAQPDGRAVARKYFSGGFQSDLAMTVDKNPYDAAQVPGPVGKMLDFTVGLNVNGTNPQSYHIDAAMAAARPRTLTARLKEMTDLYAQDHRGKGPDFRLTPLSDQEHLAWLKDRMEDLSIFDKRLISSNDQDALHWRGLFNELKSLPPRQWPFTIQKLVFRSPMIGAPPHTADVAAYYYLPKSAPKEKEGFPAAVILSFMHRDAISHALSVYYASQGIAVLQVVMPMFGERSLPGMETVDTPQKYVMMGIDPQQFRRYIVQSIADTLKSVNWLSGRPNEIDASNISVIGQSMNASVAASVYAHHASIQNLFVLTPIVNYAGTLLGPRGSDYDEARKQATANGHSKQSMAFAMDGLNLDQVGDAYLKQKPRRGSVVLVRAQSDELVLPKEYDTFDRVFKPRYTFTGDGNHVKGALRGAINLLRVGRELLTGDRAMVTRRQAVGLLLSTVGILKTSAQAQTLPSMEIMDAEANKAYVLFRKKQTMTIADMKLELEDLTVSYYALNDGKYRNNPKGWVDVSGDQLPVGKVVLFRSSNEAGLKVLLIKLFDANAAMLSPQGRQLSGHDMTNPGGIDLNTDGMQWTVNKEGKKFTTNEAIGPFGVEMNIDPAAIERVRHEGINSLTPVIFRITPVASIRPLVGFESR